MKTNRSLTFWIAALFVAGAGALAYRSDLLGNQTTPEWAVTFALAALAFFVGYLWVGARQWLALIPAVVCADLSLVVALNLAEMPAPQIAGVYLAGLSLPFWLGLVISPRAKGWAWIPGLALVALGIVVATAVR